MGGLNAADIAVNHSGISYKLKANNILKSAEILNNYNI